MMAQSGLPESYWEEAIATTTYMKNHSATRAPKKATPYEKWYGKMPDLSQL